MATARTAPDDDGLTPEERAELAAIDDMEDVEPFADFVARVSGRFAVVPPHLQPVYDLVQRSRYEQVFATVSEPPRSGKRVADSTPVFTPGGWRTHGELEVGDRVFAIDGMPTKIVHVSRRGVTDRAVVFSDGEVVRVHDGHLWTVIDRDRARRRVVLNTKQLADKLHNGKMRNGSPRARFLVDYAAPIQMPDAALPIDPYVFGLWLGDGTTGNGRITASAVDAEHHMRRMRELGYRIGATNVHRTTGVVTFCVLGMRIRSVVGMSKFVPTAYLVASEHQRRELLRGLIDSDGHVGSDGRVRFTNTNERLARDVADVASTLGYRVSLTRHAGHSSTTIPRCTATRDHFAVTWTPTDGERQAWLPRKDIRHRAVKRLRSIVNIRSCAPEQGKCIQVDHPSKLYLVGRRMVPTHNTTTFALAFAWRVLYDPACQNFYTTYADDRSANVGRTVQRLIESMGVPLDRSARGVSDWKTTFGGGLKSTSLGGQITGEGANGGLIIADDLLKGYKAAHSLAVRDDVWNYLTTDVMSRIEGGASFICMNTRWHEDDPIGRIEENPLGLGEIAGTKPWIHINMPAIHDGRFNPVDERERPDLATPLWLDVDSGNPGSREAAMRWYAMCRARSELAWWSLYQGVPRSKEAKLFGDETYYDMLTWSWNGKRGAIVLDPAATIKTSADWSAIGAFSMQGYGDDAVMDVVEVDKRHDTIPAMTRIALDWQRRYRLTLGVEAIGGFKAIPQMIKEIAPTIQMVEIVPLGDKRTRAIPASNAWNAGRIRVPRPDQAKWNVEGYVRVMKKFSGLNDSEDDVVDITAHAWNLLWRDAPAVRRDSYRAPVY